LKTSAFKFLFIEGANMWTVLLLISSNVFMTLAWYGHLRFKGFPLWLVILVSWVIALPEYALQVPANRMGHGQFSAAQLKIIQEVISLVVFFIFAMIYLGEKPTLKTGVAFMLIIGAVVVAFWDDGKIN
jgi:uncharacterized protein (DUF486 family)